MSRTSRSAQFAGRWALSIALGVLLLAWTLRAMVQEIALEAPGESPWALLWRAFQDVTWSTVLVYSLLFGLSHAFKVWRWMIQLRAVGVQRVRDAMHASLLGLAAVAILPLRLGELVRPMLIQRGGEISYTTALATTVVERVIDGLIVCALLFAALQLAPYGGDALITTAAVAALVLFVGVSVAIAGFQWFPGVVARSLEWTVGRVAPRLSSFLLRLLREFQQGVGALRGHRSLGLYVLGCVGYWGLNGGALAYWLTQFGFPMGVWVGLSVVAVLIIGIMLPSGPGFLGNFQVFLLAGVAMWLPESMRGEGAANVMAAAISLNLLQILLQLGFALPSMRWLHAKKANGDELRN